MPEVTTLRSFIADHSYDDAENLLALLDTALREAATEARRELLAKVERLPLRQADVRKYRAAVLRLIEESHD